MTTWKDQTGFTLIELLMVTALVVIVAAIAVPRLITARTASNEASVIGSLRAVTSAQSIFAASCGGGFFAPTLARLSTPPAGGAGSGSGFIGTDLSTDPSLKSSYAVALSAGPPAAASPASCNGAPAATLVPAYFVGADPVGIAGARHFGANQAGTIYQSTAPVPITLQGAPAGATPIP